MKKRRCAVLPTNIVLLQNVVRRDPQSYHEEFLQQYAHYESLRDIFLLNSASDKTEEFGELVGFVTAVCQLYPKETASFPADLRSMLSSRHRDLQPELREKIIQSLTTLRNKDVISAEELLQTLFPLLTAYSSATSTPGQHAKQLRRQVYSTLVSLLKSVNTGSRAQRLNRATQALLFGLLEQRDSHGLWATKLTRELWRRGIWDDSRTVELMAQAAVHPDQKVAVAGARFFLGADKERDDMLDDSSDEEGFDLSSLKHKATHNKASKKRAKKLEQATKQSKKRAKHQNATHLNFSAIHLLRDPQGFAETLYDKHLAQKNRLPLEHRILFMNLVSRMVGTHKLTVLGLYTFFLRYLTPKQRDVTQILAASAQAAHDLVPPENIAVVVRKIADEFVSDGVAAEVASAGINTIREILARAPLAIEKPLLHDLIAYKGSKSKAVMMAARSLIGLFRDVAPEMLPVRDRGKDAAIAAQAGIKALPKFGEEATTTMVPGIELLKKWKEENKEEEEEDDGWEIGSDSDSEGEWVNVSGEEIELEEENEENEEENEENEDEENGEENEDEDEDGEEKDQVNGENKPSRRRAKKAAKPRKGEIQAAERLKAAQEAQKTMTEVLSSDILTPADFAQLQRLREGAGIQEKTRATEDEVDSTTLVGKVKYKQLREERIAQAKEGREDRDKFGSRRGKRDAPHSTTNKEKARKKNFVMMIHKKAVQGKQKLSLRDRQKVLKAHVERQKKKGH